MYKIAICDDNKKYVDFLEQIICQVSEKPQDNIIYKFYSGEEFLENPASSFDLLFLDMKMENGIVGLLFQHNLKYLKA